MILTQYYLDCLSQASYLVGDESTGRAVVVDPRRDVGEYLADAGAQGLTIELVVETHFHADFLSGTRELAAADGLTDYDDELVFLGCLLHDLGVTDYGWGDQRFEVEGADAAARFLRRVKCIGFLYFLCFS